MEPRRQTNGIGSRLSCAPSVCGAEGPRLGDPAVARDAPPRARSRAAWRMVADSSSPSAPAPPKRRNRSTKAIATITPARPKQGSSKVAQKRRWVGHRARALARPERCRRHDHVDRWRRPRPRASGAVPTRLLPIPKIFPAPSRVRSGGGFTFFPGARSASSVRPTSLCFGSVLPAPGAPAPPGPERRRLSPVYSCRYDSASSLCAQSNGLSPYRHRADGAV
jgi:hypothetical protein